MRHCLAWLVLFLFVAASQAESSIVTVEGQPLAANARRLAEALEFLGSPLPRETAVPLDAAVREVDAKRLQQLLDPHTALVVTIDPDANLHVHRGPAEMVLQQAGFTPALVKVLNHAGIAKPLFIVSPQSGPVYGGVAELSMKRQQQEELRANENRGPPSERFLQLEMFGSPPMTSRLSGLAVEYVVALIYSSESGKRKATLGFSFVPEAKAATAASIDVALEVRPAVPVKLRVRDFDGQPTVARLLFRDQHGRVYPPQPKRLAPDFFFQPHIYRGDGSTVLLPPGKFRAQYSRGPEYRVLTSDVTISAETDQTLEIDLQRWVNPNEYGFFGGDHHIHAAGCAHYTFPTEGVTPEDMFLQVKGEGLSVGCILTWGPCFDHQRTFFAPTADDVSEAYTLLKYDLEISGFGSQALGHVCLLNLQNQTYPGTNGTIQGWPTWTTPVMRWAKEQGGFAGYAHSASGLHIDPAAAAGRLLEQADADQDGMLISRETANVLLPEGFAAIDADEDGKLNRSELTASLDRAADRLPNYAIPEMNGVGAMEICVSTAEGVCDFISAMDTARIQEWNTWYHLLNCGFPLKVSGETDFPCMSSRNVGQGRVYVQLGSRRTPCAVTGGRHMECNCWLPEKLDYADWCRGLAEGRSYVSDGYAHALDFRIADKAPGMDEVRLDAPGEVIVAAKCAFAPELPRAVAYGTLAAPEGRRKAGDTVLLHYPRSEETGRGGERLVEIVVNGEAVASRRVPADGAVHDLQFTVPIARSSWVALRHFPQLHTNPVNVLVAGEPIRASRDSARWCIAMTELLWKNRERAIAAPERPAARAAFERALAVYRRIAEESAD